jgi:hypothetical protein
MLPPGWLAQDPWIAHAKLHPQQVRIISVDHRPASADHAAGSVPVSWLLYSHLHSGGPHSTQVGCHSEPQQTHGCVSAMIGMIISMMWQSCFR